MKKIILFCHGIGNGGAERVLLTIANSLSNRDYAVSVATTNPPHNDYTLDKKVNRFFCIPKIEIPVIRVLSRIIIIRKLIKSERPNVIISFSANINVQVLLATLFLKPKKIVSERTDPKQYPSSSFGRFIRNKVYHLADSIVFQTEDAKKYFSNKIQEKGTVICNPLCIEVKENCYSKQKRMIGVGSLGEQKNWNIAIQAFRKFYSNHPDYYFDIYGEGPQKEDLLTLINQLSLTNVVNLKGFTEKIVEEMMSSSIYISSSLYEGISNAMLEALSLGIPAVCTDCPVGGARMFIDNGANGYLVPVNDINAMADAMEKIVDDKTIAEEALIYAERIRHKLSLEKVTDQWESIIK